MEDNSLEVTVVIPAYNHEKYIVECLDAIHHQSYRDFQWIVTDDNSSDHTPEILKELQGKYGYELILNEKNVGIAASMNHMIKKAKGKYIFPCASDDVYMPDKIEKQLLYLKSNPDYGMCYSRVVFIDQDSNEIGKNNNHNFRSGDLFNDLLMRRYHLGAAIAMKKSILEEIGLYKDGIIAEDYYMNCRIAENTKIGFCDDYLMKYRVAPVGGKRDPWRLVLSHRQTIDYFSHRKEYPSAVRNWELRSGAILAPYKKYKIKALSYSFKNFFKVQSLKEFAYLFYIIYLVLLRWEKCDY